MIPTTTIGSGELYAQNRRPPPVPEDMTIGEIGRRVTELTIEVRSLRDQMETGVRHADLDGIERRVSALEDTQRWLVRLIVAVIVMALLAVVLVQGTPTT